MPSLVVVRCAGCGAPLGRWRPGTVGVCRTCRVAPPVPLPTEAAAKALSARAWLRLDRAIRRAGAADRGMAG
jgi:hypothetical protein